LSTLGCDVGSTTTPQAASARYAGSPTGGSCVPMGGVPTGTLTAVGPVTLCCP
jgi:hypothetical protein